MTLAVLRPKSESKENLTSKVTSGILNVKIAVA